MKIFAFSFLLLFAHVLLADDALEARKVAADAARAKATEMLKVFQTKHLATQRAAINAFSELIKGGYDSGNQEIVNKWEKARDDYMQIGKVPGEAPDTLIKLAKEAKLFGEPPPELFEAVDDAIAKLKADGQNDYADRLWKTRSGLKAMIKSAATSTAPASAPAFDK